MTQKEALLQLFRDNNNRLTLGQILQYPFGYEARARFTELRKLGFIITFERGASPSQNVYRLIEPIKAPVYDIIGQAVLI